MALRLIETVVPEDQREALCALLRERKNLDVWCHPLSEGRVLVKVLLQAADTEKVLDLLERRYSGMEDFRVVLLPVVATLPRPAEPDTAEATTDGSASPEEAKRKLRISREELYSGLVDQSGLSRVYVVMVLLSSVVAAIGVLRDNIAIIIGAMVIAPLLGPNVALCLAATLGDMDLARRALKANAVGVLLAVVVSTALGACLPVDPALREITSRTVVGFGDVALALASGCAGVLAYTSGVSATLIGVMVAVALLPPTVTCGLLLGAGFLSGAAGALLLVATNVICINLSGVVTFLVQGIRPRTWWEADKARRTARVAIVFWALLLLALAAVILIVRRGPDVPAISGRLAGTSVARR